MYSTCLNPLSPLLRGANSLLMSAFMYGLSYAFSVFLVFQSNSAISFCVKLTITAVQLVTGIAWLFSARILFKLLCYDFSSGLILLIRVVSTNLLFLF